MEATLTDARRHLFVVSICVSLMTSDMVVSIFPVPIGWLCAFTEERSLQLICPFLKLGYLGCVEAVQARVGKEFPNTREFQKGMSLLRTKSGDDEGTVTPAGPPPDGSGRVLVDL